MCLSFPCEENFALKVSFSFCRCLMFDVVSQPCGFNPFTDKNLQDFVEIGKSATCVLMSTVIIIILINLIFILKALGLQSGGVCWSCVSLLMQRKERH